MPTKTKLPELVVPTVFDTPVDDEPVAIPQPSGKKSNTPSFKSTADITAILMRPFLPAEIKEREGGRGKMLKYVTGTSVIRRLIEATDNNYTTRLVQQEFITIGSKDAMLVVVELTIPQLGSKQGYGVQILNERGGEDLYKGAFTDGLKKAATQFGVGLELYETEEEVNEPTPQESLAVLDEELKEALRRKGVTTMGALQKAMKEEFGTINITALQANEWKQRLNKPAF